MKIRLHRPLLADSVKTMETIDATIDAIKSYFERHHVLGWSSASKVEVMSYSNIADERTGWEKTCLVKIDGSIAAMTDELI